MPPPRPFNFEYKCGVTFREPRVNQFPFSLDLAGQSDRDSPRPHHTAHLQVNHHTGETSHTLDFVRQSGDFARAPDDF